MNHFSVDFGPKFTKFGTELPQLPKNPNKHKHLKQIFYKWEKIQKNCWGCFFKSNSKKNRFKVWKIEFFSIFSNFYKGDSSKTQWIRKWKCQFGLKWSWKWQIPNLISPLQLPHSAMFIPPFSGNINLKKLSPILNFGTQGPMF